MTIITKDTILDCNVGDVYKDGNRELEIITKLEFVLYLDEGKIKVRSSYRNNTKKWPNDSRQEDLESVINKIDDLFKQ